MMMTLLVLKSKIKTFYEKNYRISSGVIKVCLMFVSLLLITQQLDYNETLGQFWVLGLTALICGFTPSVVSVSVLFLFMCGEISGISMFLAFSIFIVFIAYFLLFGRVDWKQCYLLFAIPVLSALHIGYVVPMVAALFVSPIMLPALVMGVLLWYIVQGIGSYATAFIDVTDFDTFASLQYLSDYLMQNKMLLVTIIAFSLTFICIYIIRRGNYKHGSQIAILVGTIVMMAVELFSNIIWDLGLDLAILTLQVLFSMVIAYVVQFFRITLDYHGTRKLQFEDDEYYYYVTAVPKFKVAGEDKTVTRIVQGEGEEPFDLKEELAKALEEEEEEANSN